MDYLTNYYKNLSEQLQQKVNKLERIINEVASPAGPQVDPGYTYQDTAPPTQYTPPPQKPPLTGGPNPWDQTPPRPGTIVNSNGVNYRYDGNGMWSRQMPDGTWLPWWWAKPVINWTNVN